MFDDKRGKRREKRRRESRKGKKEDKPQAGDERDTCAAVLRKFNSGGRGTASRRSDSPPHIFLHVTQRKRRTWLNLIRMQRGYLCGQVHVEPHHNEKEGSSECFCLLCTYPPRALRTSQPRSLPPSHPGCAVYALVSPSAIMSEHKVGPLGISEDKYETSRRNLEKGRKGERGGHRYPHRRAACPRLVALVRVAAA